MLYASIVCLGYARLPREPQPASHSVRSPSARPLGLLYRHARRCPDVGEGGPGHQESVAAQAQPANAIHSPMIFTNTRLRRRPSNSP